MAPKLSLANYFKKLLFHKLSFLVNWFFYLYADTHSKIITKVENQTSNTRNVLKEWRSLRNYNGIFNCPAILDGNKEAIKTAKKYVQSNPRHPIKDTEFLEIPSNCSSFKRQRGYTNNPVSEEEREFPLAFSILFHKDLEQVENLLRIIYRPQNWYCLHLDADAPQVCSDAFLDPLWYTEINGNKSV